MASAASASSPRSTGDRPAKTDGLAIAGGLGGKGGTGADAGDVSLTSNGNVFVNTIINVAPITGDVTFSGVEFAANAPGVVAQSIGGGGGAGGMNITGAIAPKGSPIAIGVGGTGGVGGDAGDVTVVRGYTDVNGVETATPGLITTFGDGSTGLKRNRSAAAAATPASTSSSRRPAGPRRATMSPASSPLAATDRRRATAGSSMSATTATS